MTNSNLQTEWNKIAPEWIRESREGRNANRTGLLDAATLEACGNVQGKKILDSGCGEGRFARMLAQLGAKYVLGLDLCRSLIDAAKQLAGVSDEYRAVDVQNLDFLEDEQFDLAVSYLNQCDLPDYRANSREICRVLKPGGKFVVVQVHPMRSADYGWCRGDNNEKLHVRLDNYFDESALHWMLYGSELTNFHRTLSSCINSFLADGFALTKLVEPMATPEQLEKYPEIHDETRVPNFIIYILQKN